MRTHRTHVSLALFLCALALAPAAGWARAKHDAAKGARTAPAGASVVVDEPSSPADAAEVRVEAVRPERAKLVTLGFLKANRAFIRERYDHLRERPLAVRGDAAEVDTRFLAYRELLGSALAAQDTVRAADEAGRRRALFERADQLVDLEHELDQLERTLAEQRERLAVLQRDFILAQKTELVVVLSGWPGQVPPGELTVTLENRVSITIALDDAQRDVLRRGGLVQVLHERVEPRQQIIELEMTGATWPETRRGFVTLDPAHDQLTFLRLDLTGARPDRTTGGVQARTWHLDARVPAGKG